LLIINLHKKIQKEKERNPIKTYSHEEAKGLILKALMIPNDLNHMLEIVCKDILPNFINGNVEEKDKAKQELSKMSLDLFRSLELETQANLMESVDENYRSLAKDLTSKIIIENNCTKTEEKMLAEVMVGSFIRYIDNSRRLNNEYNCTNITTNRNNYIAILSKQVDRANRQYLSSLMALKQLKSPNIEMNIKTQNAFVSNNQQINVTKESNESK